MIPPFIQQNFKKANNEMFSPTRAFPKNVESSVQTFFVLFANTPLDNQKIFENANTKNDCQVVSIVPKSTSDKFLALGDKTFTIEEVIIHYFMGKPHVL